MRIVIICNDENFKKMCVSTLSNHTLSFFDDNLDTQRVLTPSEYDLLITYNLCGFNFKTLTGSIWYNLFPIRQIHLLDNLELPNTELLNKPLSISMFFFCISDKQKNTLNTRYSNIPWLKVLDSYKSNPAQALLSAVEDVLPYI